MNTPAGMLLFVEVLFDASVHLRAGWDNSA